METTRVELMNLLKQTIRPEFLNRVDETILFTPLMQEEVKQIVRLQLNQLQDMLRKNNLNVEITDNVVNKIADDGFDPQYGARPLKRLIQKDIVNELSKRILAGGITGGKKIVVDELDGAIVFWNPEKEKATTMVS
jgi:ATP-dependent Clp protease ATP-binding subunit ClpB